MLQVSLTAYHDVAKKLVEESFPELKLVQETRVGLVYETPDDAKYLPEIKSVIKKEPTFAGLFVTVFQR